MFFFSRVNHASMSLWDENSTSLLYSHIPSSAGTWRIFPNMLCQCFFPFSWHFKREKSVFWKASFFAIQELMTLARIRVKDFATGENKFSRHWRHQILRGPLESLYKASCWDCKDFYIGKTKRSFRARGVDSHMKQTGMLVGNFVFNPYRRPSGRGSSFLWPLKETNLGVP